MCPGNPIRCRSPSAELTACHRAFPTQSLEYGPKSSIRISPDTCSPWRGNPAQPQLKRALEELRDGEDTLVVWRLDRLGRSLGHLIELMGELERRHLGFRSLTESVDTTTASGRLVFHIFGAIAEFERQLIRERTQAGLSVARAPGRHGGRRTVMTEHKLQVAREMLAGGRHTMQEIADTIGVSRATLYRHLEPVEQVYAGVEARERRSASGSLAVARLRAAARATEGWTPSAHERHAR